MLLYDFNKYLMILTIERLLGVAPEVDIREHTVWLPLQCEKGRTLSAFKIPEETSPAIRNEETNGPKMCPPKVIFNNFPISSVYIKYLNIY